MEPYEYTPLEDGQIRLLQILPGPETELVSCQLFTVSLEQLPMYTALSYAWGTGARDQTIIVDGKALHATEIRQRYECPEGQSPAWLSFYSQNMPQIQHGVELVRPLMEKIGDKDAKAQIFTDLSVVSEALEKSWAEYASGEEIPIIHHDMPLILIDAISVNQEDLAERSKQVQLMRQIYKGANSLTIWLGLEADDSSKAISVPKKVLFEVTQLDRTDRMWEKIMQDPDVQNSTASIWKLCSRPWFVRMWIVQEYALGGHPQGSRKPHGNLVEGVLFCCGKDRIEYLVQLGYHVLDGMHSSEKMGEVQVLTRLASINWVRNAIAHFRTGYKRQNQLISLVLASRSSQSTDPRDRIYASIGLAEELSQDLTTDFNHEDIIFDYTATVEDVFSSLVKAIVSGVGGMIANHWEAGSLPEQRLMYDVSCETNCVATFAQDLSTLTVRGFLWSVIKEVQMISSFQGVDTEAGIPQKLALLLEIAKTFSKSEKGQRKMELYISFLRTLVWLCQKPGAEKLMPQTWVSLMVEWLDAQPHEGHDPSHSNFGAASSEESTSAKSDFEVAVINSLRMHNNYFVTDEGYIGRMNLSAKIGDLVCIILGCAVPIILRPVDENYEVVGEAYVDMIMHGEGMVALNEGKRVLQDFELH